MALAQHSSYDVRYQQQVDNARRYLLPFLTEGMTLQPGMRVMEIGCGEGGVLVPFLEQGIKVLGVDLNEGRIQTARQFNESAIREGKADFLYKNVYDADFVAAYQGAFDLILLKDTIEHIPNQEAFIPHLKQFLTKDGTIFFGFPPWYMPFGGHQQICRSKWLGMLPWYHLLPRPLYKGILRAAGEPNIVIDELMDIQSTGISLERFERIVRKSGFHIVKKTLFLLNPIYEFKFGWKPREQFRWLAAIPGLRNFLTTAGWYLVK